MNNVYIIIYDKRNEIIYNGMQVDGGKTAIEHCKKYGYRIRIWNMGSKKHLYQLNETARAEIRSEIKAARKRARESRRATA